MGVTGVDIERHVLVSCWTEQTRSVPFGGLAVAELRDWMIFGEHPKEQQSRKKRRKKSA